MVDQTHTHSLNAGQTVKLADLPAFGVCGWSGSGKTTLIEAVIPHLRKQGLKVAVVKRTTHEITVDSPGQSSDRFFHAGADVLRQEPGEGLFRLQDAAYLDLTSSLGSLSAHYDLVLVESYNGSLLPKVWLQGASESAVPTNVQGVVASLSQDCDRAQSLLSILNEWLPLQWNNTPVFGCVLIGGKSRRMGCPKHLIQKNGKTWIQRTVELLEQTTSQVAIVGGESEMANCVHLADVPDLRGPMAGVLAAMRWAPHISWLVVACDLPLLSVPSLEWLLSTRAPGVWATLPRLQGPGRRIEPLLAHYDYRSRQLVEDLAIEGNLSLSHLGSHEKAITPARQDVDTPAELEQVG